MLNSKHQLSPFSAAMRPATEEIRDMATVFGVGINLRDPAEMGQVASTQDMSYILRDTNQLPAVVDTLRGRIPSCKFIFNSNSF